MANINIQRIEDRYCCGMRMYGGFTNMVSDSRGYRNSTYKEKVESIKNNLHKTFGGFATISSEQAKQGWLEALKEAGFTEGGSFTNPNSGNTVYQMVYTPGKKKKG